MNEDDKKEIANALFNFVFAKDATTGTLSVFEFIQWLTGRWDDLFQSLQEASKDSNGNQAGKQKKEKKVPFVALFIFSSLFSKQKKTPTEGTAEDEPKKKKVSKKDEIKRLEALGMSQQYKLGDLQSQIKYTHV